MAIVTFFQAASMTNPAIWYGTVTSATSTQLSLNNFSGSYATYYGNNFTYSGNNVTGGTITSYINYRNYSIEYTVTNANVSAAEIARLVNSGNAIGAQALALIGNDSITGSSFADTLVGYFGDDLINGLAGNDTIIAGPGNDTAIYSQARNRYTISAIDGGHQVSGPDGVDTLYSVENLRFSDGSMSLASIDLVAPSISSFSPIDGASRIQTSQNITFTFSEAIAKGAGIIYLRTGSAIGPIVEQFNIGTSDRVGINGNALIIDPTSLLESTTYFVTMGSGVIKDLSGNDFAGVSTYDFKTVKSVFDHLFVGDPSYGYGARFETTDIKVPGTVILGTLGNDDLLGSAGVDYVAGYRGLDVILTFAGNDTIYPSIERSNGDGGSGIDTLVIGRTHANSTIEPWLFNNSGAVLSSGVTVKSRLDSNVFSSFNNVERLKFLDTNIALDVQAGENAGMAYRMYKAALNRAPDLEGLGDWIGVLDNGGNIFTDLARGFTESTEFKTRYGPNLSNEAFVTLLYNNVLGRNPDQGGLNAWVGAIEQRGATREVVLHGFSESPENIRYSLSLIGQGMPYIE